MNKVEVIIVALILLVFSASACARGDLVNARTVSNTVGTQLGAVKAQIESAYVDAIVSCDEEPDDIGVEACRSQVDEDFKPIVIAYRSLRSAWLAFESVLTAIEMGEEAHIERLPELLSNLVSTSLEVRALVELFASERQLK